MRPGKLPWSAAILFLVPLVLMGTMVPSTAEEPTAPSLSLFAARDNITAYRYGKWVYLDLGTWITPTGGAFEIRASRPDYDSPVDLRQVDAQTGATIRDLPDDLLQGWFGLDRFFRMTVRTKGGKWVAGRTLGFCPNDGEHQRLNDTGPPNSVYPWVCGGHPLTRGMVWGIDDGWAVGTFGWYGGPELKLKPKKYTVTLKIRSEYATLLEVPKEDRKVTVGVTVKKGSGGYYAKGRPEKAFEGAPEPGVPDVDDPDPSTLPNLVAMPAWAFETFSRKGRDYLAFAAMEWNEGPAPLVVEGFRRQGEDVMDAYQYFHDGDGAVGRASVGTFEYHGSGGHNHWHFEQFTRYSLLDASQTEVVRSKKQSWCLAPTDAVDLTTPGANWNPGSLGLHTACGSESSLWVREILDVGWGDTYFQYYGGQAFNITNLPNGKYFVEVHVNPTGDLYETDTSDNVVLRQVKLKGKAGNRWAKWSPWHGIDTEEYYSYGY
ncbi:MAG: lysyl oxidase family protein [Actinomycetota bacterium]